MDFDDEFIEHLEEEAFGGEQEQEPWVLELQEKLQELEEKGLLINEIALENIGKLYYLLAEILSAQQLSGDVALDLSGLEQGLAAVEMTVKDFCVSERRFTRSLFSQAVSLSEKLHILPDAEGGICLRFETEGLVSPVPFSSVDR